MPRTDFATVVPGRFWHVCENDGFGGETTIHFGSSPDEFRALPEAKMHAQNNRETQCSRCHLRCHYGAFLKIKSR